MLFHSNNRHLPVDLNQVIHMLITVEFPQQLPDMIQCSAADFERQAKMAMASKLYEMGKLSSGMAAQMLGMGRVEFLMQLGQYGVALIDLDEDELAGDLSNA
jgi:predicted HTH domain antitoxin